MARKLYMAPSLLLGPVVPGGDEEEEMEHSQEGSGQGPSGAGVKSIDIVVDDQPEIIIGE